MTDAINPDHYKQLPAEAIEIIESAIDKAPSNQDAYLHGQVLKYVLRCWDKNGIEDLKKAKWYLDRLIDSFDTEPDAVAKENLKTEKWIPKVGDWVKINKPKSVDDFLSSWMPGMDRYDGQVVQVTEIDAEAIIHDEWAFCFEWLEPSKAPFNSDKIPEGYRKLNDSSEEPRQLGDLRWSVSEKRYIPISGDEIGYANRDNWAACRKVAQEVKPPDGWRFLERGEVIHKGDMFLRNGLLYEIDSEVIGKSCYKHLRPVIRRNRFEVGEKVVDCRAGVIFTVQHDDSQHQIAFLDGVSNGVEVRHLAPFVEDAK